MRFYDQLAMEVNQACDNGRLPAGPLRKSMSASWDSRYFPQLLKSLRVGYRRLVHLTNFRADVPASRGLPVAKEWFVRITRSPLAMDTPILGFRFEARRWIGWVYQCLLPWLTPLAALALCIQGILLCLRTRSITTWIALAAGVAVMIRLGLLAWINVTAFPGLTLPYLAPTIPVLLLFIILSLLGTAQILCIMWAHHRKRTI